MHNAVKLIAMKNLCVFAILLCAFVPYSQAQSYKGKNDHKINVGYELYGIGNGIKASYDFGLNELFNARLSKYKLVLMSQKAEHEYAGVMCGIMDQYASMFGKKDHVLRLDCRTHEHEYYQLDMKELVIALCDTGIKHKLASSEYNTRREECETGVRILQKNNSAFLLRFVYD